MYEDLNQIAQLKLSKEIESISKDTLERVKEIRREYTALAGSSVGRSGQHEASVGRVQIDGAEQMVRALYRIWVDLIKQRKDHISRPDIAFIANKVDGYARTQKGHLHKAFSSQRMGAVINLLTQEGERQMYALAADARRDLEIMVREQEVFPKEVAVKQDEQVTLSRQTARRITRHFADVLNILIASPSDVNEERDVVTQSVHEWNAAHFSTTGIMLNPLRWESHAYPASGDRPQAIINRQIVESGDILIAIFGYKLGTPTGEAQSGTIEEIEEFRKSGKYVALYFSTADVPRSADRAQLAALESYKKERQKDTLYFDFEDASSLRDHVTRHLPKIVHEVHEKLNLLGLAYGLKPESAVPEESANSRQGIASAQSPALLADIISELEDNLDCASTPRAGDVYRRPSTRVWLEYRNKITLPPDIYLEVKNTYSRISNWGDVVASGLNPNMGSMELSLIVSDLKSALPTLIERLREFQKSSPEQEGAADQIPQVKLALTLPRRQRSLDFLPDLNPKEIELVVSVARDENGQIFCARVAGREVLSIGSQAMLNSDSSRNRAEWIGAIKNLVSLGLLEAAGLTGEFYRLTDLGYAAADELGDFSRWATNQVTVEALYMNAPPESLTTACSAIIQLPAVYYQYRVRSDAEVMRSEKEPRSLLLEGVDLEALNEISWQPTGLSFVVSGTDEAKSFLVERTDDHRFAKFHISSGA
ncbi:MAG: hypothetical protein ABR906_08930 [Terracidiphilus sp.]|jgi:hypothetical protein